MKKLIALLLLISTQAFGQSFPNKPIRIIVPFPPGGGTDVVARTVAPKMQEALGQPVIVENRAGAGGNIGTEAVAKSPADGYTLIVASAASAINHTLAKNPGWDLNKDFAPVVLLVLNQSLLSAQSRHIEQALWVAIKGLEERSQMIGSFARTEGLGSIPGRRGRYEQEASRLREHARTLRDLVLASFRGREHD